MSFEDERKTYDTTVDLSCLFFKSVCIDHQVWLKSVRSLEFHDAGLLYSFISCEVYFYFFFFFFFRKEKNQSLLPYSKWTLYHRWSLIHEIITNEHHLQDLFNRIGKQNFLIMIFIIYHFSTDAVLEEILLLFLRICKLSKDRISFKSKYKSVITFVFSVIKSFPIFNDYLFKFHTSNHCSMFDEQINCINRCKDDYQVSLSISNLFWYI